LAKRPPAIYHSKPNPLMKEPPMVCQSGHHATTVANICSQGALAICLGLCWAAAGAAEPAAGATQAAAKPAAAKATKPTGKAEAAGIIVLDGKAPPAKPTKGAEAATGIGLGGCAACDKTTPANAKKPDTVAKDKTATGK
jgi:hypothetical protein